MPVLHKRIKKNVYRLGYRFLFFLFFSLGVVFLSIYYLGANQDKYFDLLRISPIKVFYLFLIASFSLLINGIISTLLFQGLDVDLSYKNGFFLSAASSFANQLPISGGVVARGIYLKKKYDLSYASFFGASAALFICFLSANGFVGMLILFYGMFFKSISYNPTLLLTFVLMFASLFVFFVPIDKVGISKKLKKQLSYIAEGWTLFQRNPNLMMKLIFLQMLAVLLLAIRYWLAFQMLSQPVNLSEVMLFSSASVLTQLVSIAPGGIGVREAIVGSMASLLGFDLDVGVLAVGLDHLTETFIIFLIGGISTIMLGKQISAPNDDENGKR